MLPFMARQAARNPHKWAAMQLRAKKEAMEAALAARDEAGSVAAGEDGWDASSQASGMSAVSGMSVYTAAQSGATPSASAGASAYAPSTVGGRKPARQRKQKVKPPCLLLYGRDELKFPSCPSCVGSDDQDGDDRVS